VWSSLGRCRGIGLTQCRQGRFGRFPRAPSREATLSRLGDGPLHRTKLTGAALGLRFRSQRAGVEQQCLDAPHLLGKPAVALRLAGLFFKMSN
jgi:hypothetical protein